METRVEVRATETADRAAVLALASRLEIGMSPWRDREAVARTVRNWIEASLDAEDDTRASFVAAEDGVVVGFVSVEEQDHWSGDPEAYIGELIVADDREGRGIGRALVERAAAWGRERGRCRIALDTGAGNERALAFYRAIGFDHDEVRLSRALT
ncbi:MAG: GNAT family N-acetyltransferase [Actinomycetota bacterium]